MNNKTLILRPMMKISDMVPYLKNKNIKFECCSEQDAEIYCKSNRAVMHHHHDHPGCSVRHAAADAHRGLLPQLREDE